MTELEFENVYNRFHKGFVAYAAAWLNNFEEGRDIVHSAFADLWQRQYDNNPEAYLAVNIKHRIINYKRDKKIDKKNDPIYFNVDAIEEAKEIKSDLIKMIIDRSEKMPPPHKKGVFYVCKWI